MFFNVGGPAASQRTDDGNAVYIHNAVPFSCRNIKFTGKWTELENILIGITQIQKGKCYMFSFICPRFRS